MASEVAARSPLGPWETFWILFYGFATYGNAGWMREQVCKYMCPYARFQSAMFDPDTLIITYDRERGEPRGSRARKADPKALGLGDCVDCNICVQVCPTGIDIRDGLQYECIGCAACIDGCDQVMDKMGYPHGPDPLLDRERDGAEAGRARRCSRRAFAPARAASTRAILARHHRRRGREPVAARAAQGGRDPRPGGIAREVEGGEIENVYQLQIMNTSEHKRVFDIEAAGLPTIHLDGETHVELPGADSRVVPLRARVHVGPGAAAPGSHRIEFLVHAHDDPAVFVRETSVFVVR